MSYSTGRIPLPIIPLPMLFFVLFLSLLFSSLVFQTSKVYLSSQCNSKLGENLASHLSFHPLTPITIPPDLSFRHPSVVLLHQTVIVVRDMGEISKKAVRLLSLSLSPLLLDPLLFSSKGREQHRKNGGQMGAILKQCLIFILTICYFLWGSCLCSFF
ncbi:hypothetical protein CEXT_293791 [Caerostris extrusa]|uniref:Transmembrane protein n=1 Tax=Caerostris extrusa TaxID=172846 RepID=A0AAV4VD25_CAEEX|nr:hypothetical protein CEXT_293791 [Caerostris extrusa]